MQAPPSGVRYGLLQSGDCSVSCCVPQGVTSLDTKAQRGIAALLVGIVLALGAIAPVAASGRVPKVAIIVGPVGGITANYKALANEAARVEIGRAHV